MSDSPHGAVSFVFVIVRRVPRDRREALQLPSIAALLEMIRLRLKAHDLVGNGVHFAIATYRSTVFIDRLEFSRALGQAQTERSLLLLGDVFSYMRNLDFDAAVRCMKVLDTARIEICNARDGRLWSSYSQAERQSLYFAVRSASVVHGVHIKRRMPKGRTAAAEITTDARSRAAATLSRNADRRALELEEVVEKIGKEFGQSPVTASFVANELNRLGIKSARGKDWSITAAKRLLERIHKLRSG